MAGLAGLLHSVPVGAEVEDVVWPCQVPEESFIQVPLREYDGQPQPASPGRQGQPSGTAPEPAALPAPPLPHLACLPGARRGRAGAPGAGRHGAPSFPGTVGGGMCVWCPRPPRRSEVTVRRGGERSGEPRFGLRGAPGRAAPDKEREQLGPPGEKVDAGPPCEMRPGACRGGKVSYRGWRAAGERQSGLDAGEERCVLGCSPREGDWSKPRGDGRLGS